LKDEIEKKTMLKDKIEKQIHGKKENSFYFHDFINPTIRNCIENLLI
jgi:hypothetical protein